MYNKKYNIFTKAIRRRKHDKLGMSRLKSREVIDPITVEIRNELDTARSHFRVDVANSGLIWSKRVYVDNTPKDQYANLRVRGFGLYRHEYCYSMSDIRTVNYKEIIRKFAHYAWWMDK